LKIAAVADLGGLGAEEGPAVAYNAILASVLPSILPWLLVLLLFLPKANRGAQAWWVLVPLVIIAGTSGLIDGIGEFSATSPTVVFLEVLTALAFGLTVTWLLAPYVRRSHRLLTLLVTLLTLAAGSMVVFLLRRGWDQEWGRGGGAIAIVILLCTVALSVALCLAGLVCRRRYSRRRLFFWLLGLMAGLWLLIGTPFYVAALMGQGGGPTFLQFCLAVLVLLGLSFGPLLPFLVLGFSNGFYGERLKRLLHAEPAAPPVMTAPPTTNAKV
jgi:hypothetical protein